MHIDNDYLEIKKKLIEIMGENHPAKLPTIPGVIQRRRIELGYSQSQIFVMTGIRQDAISRIEKGVNSPKSRMVNQCDSNQKDSTAKFKAIDLYAISSVLKLELKDVAILPESFRLDITVELLRSLREKLLEVGLIFTLIKPELKTKVTDVYCPTKLIHKKSYTIPSVQRNRIGYENNRQTKFTQHDSIDDFHDKCILITGIAGQGKSMYLRYLAVKATDDEKILPIFVELRKLKDESLLDYLFNKLNNCGVCQNQYQLEYICRMGNLVLFLDAVDEIPVNKRGIFINELSQIREEFSELRIFITSRLDSGITSEVWLEEFQIAKLTSIDVDHLIKKYATEEESEKIIYIKHNTVINLSELLTTPIFVVLLVIHFRYLKSVPETVSSFYQDLLDVLIRRHNIGDIGLKREIRSGLNIYELKKFFEALSFVVERDFGDDQIHINELETCAIKVSEKFIKKTFSCSLATEDIIGITNLIIEEGGYCCYVHKSVREYLAAVFIKEAYHEDSVKFYTNALKKWRKWSGVLDFLSIIDRKRFVKYFEIPDTKKAFHESPIEFLTIYQTIKFEDRSNSTRTMTFSNKICKSVGLDTLICQIPINDELLKDIFGETISKHISNECRRVGYCELTNNTEKDGMIINWNSTNKIHDALKKNNLIGEEGDSVLEDSSSLILRKIHHDNVGREIMKLEEEIRDFEERGSEFDI